MIKRKATKKTAKKNLKTSIYTRIAPNIYKDVSGSYCVRKMVDGVRHCKSVSSIKAAKTFLNSL
jgi:hypothetical protein